MWSATLSPTTTPPLSSDLFRDAEVLPAALSRQGCLAVPDFEVAE